MFRRKISLHEGNGTVEFNCRWPAPIASHIKTEWTNRSQEQYIRMALKWSGSACIKKQGNSCKSVVGRESKMEAIWSSETSVDFQRTTWRHTLGDSTLHKHRCENLKSYKLNNCTVLKHVKILTRAEGQILQKRIFFFILIRSAFESKRNLVCYDWIKTVT
jgi:hypothetical protein